MTTLSQSPRASRNNRLLFACYHNYLDPSNGASIQLGYNPVDNGGGLRCFSEQSEPGGDVHNEILTMATLAAPIPSGMTGTVFVDWFDPDNPRGSLKTPDGNGPGVRDNHGMMVIDGEVVVVVNNETVRKGAEVTFASGTQQQWKTCTIDPAHAGDNYIIAAHPNEDVVQRAEIDVFNIIAVPVTVSGGSGGISYKALTKSDILTVWRTLHVEIDALQNSAGQLSVLPPLTGLPTGQYRRACIELKPYSQPAPSAIIATFDGIHYQLNNPSEISAIKAKRYSPPPSNSFWTVHLVGSFYRYDSVGPQWGIGGWSPSNSLPSTALVFTTTAEWQVDNYCPTLTYQQKLELAYYYKQWLIAHEIGHVMGCEHSATGIMYGGKYGGMSPDYLLKDPNYWKFLDENIRAMQASKKPE